MSRFGDYAVKNLRVCRYCRFEEEFPPEAEDIRGELRKGRLSTKKPTAYASLVASYISSHVGFAITSSMVRDHFRRSHDKESE
jgi:hypothetical protein